MLSIAIGYVGCGDYIIPKKGRSLLFYFQNGEVLGE